MTNACKVHGPLGVLHCRCRDLEREAAQRQATAARIEDLEARLEVAERELAERRANDEGVKRDAELAVQWFRSRNAARTELAAAREDMARTNATWNDALGRAFDRQSRAERERDDWKRIVDQNLDASAVTVAELAAARKALEGLNIPARGLIHVALHIVNNGLLGQADPERLALEDAAAWLHAVLSPPPDPCASCGQDPAGGHNFGCLDGAAELGA